MANNSANYNVNMRFTADTGQAKQQLRDLQSSLDTLMNQIATKNIKFFDVNATKKEIDEASAAVQELKIALDQATNVDTGRLDLSKFSKSLSQSGYTLQDFATHLENLGPTGDKAFVALAQSVINAEVPLKRTNALLDNFKKTIANTARWQISSNLMHGVQGSIQKAYYYAEDLNKSLNNIRIVTGQSSDQMAQFAEKANKAAQALSTTTTNYTNASLIYYQQGLSDKEVADRTEVTIKMANAAGESASKVSDQLTAVWNNFYDGSKSLEYYADVMTKLGAYTASSTDEISEGIQKFASVANTIGLSYEYATSALATLTAKTRESANTVGNSLKTLFARIQGLTLGETLEDGTDLNKYSLALEKVGISIKDQQGELKDMNTILDEMMNKWDSLSRAEQVALAQTVGGVRQYTQLVNLMENKDYFKELVGVAKNSEGTLQKQADIYAESWEASKKRVQASLEEIYKQLVNDKFFIGLNDTLSDTLNITSELIDSLGGLPGVLGVVSTLMLKSFGPDIVNNMQRMASNLFIDSGAAENQAAVMKKEMIQTLQSFSPESKMELSDQGSVTLETTTMINAAQASYDLQIANSQLNETDKLRLQTLLKISQAYGDIAVQAKKSIEVQQQQTQDSLREARNQIFLTNNENFGGDAGVKYFNKSYKAGQKLIDSFYSNRVLKQLNSQKFDNSDSYQNFLAKFNNIKGLDKDQRFDRLNKLINKAKGASRPNIQSRYRNQIIEEINNLKDVNVVLDKYVNGKVSADGATKKQVEALRQCLNEYVKEKEALIQSNNANKKYTDAINDFEKTLAKSQGAVMNFSQGIVSGAQGISQFTIGINSIRSAIQALNNEDLTFGEKVLQITTSISFAIPSIIYGFTNLQKSIQSINSSKGLIGINILQLVTGLNEIKEANLGAELQKLSAASKTSGLRFKALNAMTDAYNTSLKGAKVGANGLTQAMAEQAAGTAALKAGINAIARSLGIYIAIAAAVAAVIVGIVHLNEVAKTKTLESQLARSEEAAANFEKQLEKTKSKAEELKNVFNNYKNIKKSLDECTIGTEEWRKKLQETNETALEILKNYPELKNIEGAWGKKDTGEIWIDESALKGLQSEYDNKILSQSYSLAKQNQNSNELKNAIAQKNSFNDITLSYGATFDDLEGSHRPEKDERTFNALEYIRNNFQNYKGYSDDLILNDIYSYLNKEGYNNIEDQAYQEKLTQFINEINPTLQSLISTIEENTNATLQVEQESVVQQKLGKTNMSSQEVKLTTEAYNKAIEDKIAEMKQVNLNGEWTGRIIYEGLTIGTHDRNAKDYNQVQELWDTYLKSQGIDVSDIDYRLSQNNSVEGKGQDRYFVYGQDQKVSFEEVIQAVAQYEVDQSNFLTELNQAATNFLTNLGKIQYTNETKQEIESGGTLGKGLSSFIGNKDLTELTQKEIDNLGELTEDTLKERVAAAMGFDYAKATKEQLAELDDQLIAIYGAVGVDSGEEFVEQFNTAIINYGKETEKIANSFYGKWATAENLNSFTLEVQKKLKSTFVDIFRVSGEEGIAVFEEIISKYGSDLTPELLDLIGDFDWTQSGAIDNFISALEDLGILTDDNTEAWKRFSSQMAEAANNLPIDKLTNLRDILEDIYKLLGKDVGSIFSQEDIDKLTLGGYDIEGHYAQVGSDEYVKTRDYTTEEKNKAYEQQIQTAEKKNEIIYGANDQNQAQVQSKVDSWGKYGDKYISGEWDNLSPSYVKSYIDSIGGIENAATITGWDQDNFSDKYLNSITSQERAEIVDAIVKGINSVYNGQTDTGVITASHLYNSSDSINEMTQMEGFRDEEGSVSDSGIEAISGKLAGSEEGLELLHKYQDEIKNVTKGTEEWDKITNQFIKDSQGLEYKEQAKELGNYNDKLKEAKKAGEDYEEEIGNVKKQLNKMLDIEVDDDFIEKYQDEIDKMLSGETLEERQSAANTIKFQAEIDTNETQSKLDQFAQQFGPEAAQTIQNAIPDIELDAQGNIVLTGDSGQAVAAIMGVIGALEGTTENAEIAGGLLSSILGTQITINTDGLKKLQELAQALTSGDLQAIADWATNNQELNNILTFNGEGRTANIEPTYRYENGGSKGGGGGGGSESKSANDIGKEIQDELLKTKEKKRDRLEALREGANPEDSAKYIQEEIKLLEEEQDILEDQIKSWKKLLKLKVEEFNKEHPEFEIKLTDDGEIANASELWGKVWAQYQKNLEDGMSEEDLNEWFTKIKDGLDGPMGIQQNIDENVALIAQKEKEAAELELEAITKQIDWKVKQIDFQIKRLNYYQEKLLKQAHGNKQTIEAMLEGFAYQEQEMLQLFDKGATLRQGIDELNAAKAKYPGYEQMFDEQILEYQSDLIDVNEAILDLRNDIEDLVQNVLDLALDEIDKQIERLDTYTSMLDHLNNIIDLSGRSMLDMGLKTQIGATKVETMLGKMKSLKGQMDGLTKATKEAQAALADRQADGDTSSVKFWENQVEVLKQETEKASDEFLASWEETLEAAQDLFEMRVEMAVNILSNALSPFETLEDFQDKYEKAKTVNEEYLDDAERLYELNKLNRQLNLQLADANDLLAKQKLRDIQQEIHDLQADGVKMSQYDLEYLQKKYDLQLAEIALMEQQNSKTSMRLVRDAAGNWTYAYDADEEKIEDATQKYEDAVHELEQLSKDYINDVSEQLIQNQIDFKEALQDLDKNSADYSNQLLSLQEYYVERQRYLLDELNKGVVNSGLTFHDTLYGQMTDLYDYNDAYMQFVNNSNTTITELQTNYKDWQKVVETAMGVAGTSWDNFGTDMGGTLDSLEEHIQKLCDEIEELVNVLMGYISQSIGMVLDWEQKYSKRTDEELAKNEAYIDGNFVGGGGGVDYSNVDMQTDFTALAQRWAAGERNLTNYNETKTYNSLEEIKADLDKKLDAFEHNVDILFQGSGKPFDDEAYESVYNNIYQGTYKRNGNNYGMRSYPNTTSNSIVDKASNYLGVRYRWGGTDAGYGLDCSGLVYNALNDAGIPVPRTSAQGYRDMSKAIKESSVKPGDLVFFGYGNTVDHVGIYAGNGQMIDAPGAKVQYTNIDEKRDRLLGYGRLGNTNYSSSDTAALMDRLGLSRRGGAASGAYTGDWGPGQGIGIDNGKIIKVHPKELILNKSDTRNILRAVDIVRNMNDWVDKQVQQMSSISSSKLDSLFNSAIPRYETQPIKQEVTIQADFPGVTDHYEIEEALSNLSNNAAQYISANKSK